MTRKEQLELLWPESHSSEAFFAGFEAAKKELLDKYFNTPGDHYNKQRTLDPEEIMELGNETVHQTSDDV